MATGPAGHSVATTRNPELSSNAADKAATTGTPTERSAVLLGMRLCNANGGPHTSAAAASSAAKISGKIPSISRGMSAKGKSRSCTAARCRPAPSKMTTPSKGSSGKYGCASAHSVAVSQG